MTLGQQLRHSDKHCRHHNRPEHGQHLVETVVVSYQESLPETEREKEGNGKKDPVSSPPPGYDCHETQNEKQYRNDQLDFREGTQRIPRKLRSETIDGGKPMSRK